jgi:hypothetical protein
METADYLNRLERFANEVERLHLRVAELEAALTWAQLAYKVVTFANACRPLGVNSLLEQAPASVASPASDGEGSEG